MKKIRLISALLAAAFTFSGLCTFSLAEEQLIEKNISPENVVYAFNNYEPDGGNIGYGVKVNYDLAKGYSAAMQNYGYSEYIIPDIEAVEKIYYTSRFHLQIKRSSGNLMYTVNDFIENMPENGEYVYKDKSGVLNENEEERNIAYNLLYRFSELTNANYTALENYTRPGRALAKNITNILRNEDNTLTFEPVNELVFNGTAGLKTDVTLDVTQKVIDAVKASADSEGSSKIAFVLGNGDNTRNYLDTARLTVFYNVNKLFSAAVKKAASSEDIETVINEYNGYIGANINIFDDMSEVYDEVYSILKEESEEEYTFEKTKSVFDMVVDNLIVSRSYEKFGKEGEVNKIDSDELRYNFNSPHGPGFDDYSTYMSFYTENISNTLTFTSGSAKIVIGEGKITLSDGTNTESTAISEDFKGNIILKIGIDEVMTVVVANEEERVVLSLNFDDCTAADAVFTADGTADVSDFAIQQYPLNYEKETTGKLDGILEMLEKEERENAISNYDAAVSEVENMADGIAKNELTLYLKLLSKKVEYAKDELKKADAEAAIQKAENSLKYEDYTKAEELVKLVNDEAMLKELNEKLLKAKEKFDKIVPYIVSVSVDGSWKTGATLTAKVAMEDSCGNGDGYKLEWLVNGRESGIETETFYVESSYAGATVVLRATPKNNSGAFGDSKESLEIKIPENKSSSSGGSSGKGSGGGSSVVYNVPAKKAEELTNELKITNKIENEGTIFEDISGHWAENTINNMMKKGIVKGVTAISFEPDRKIKRAEFLTIILRAADIEEKVYTNEFVDVNADDWYSGVVATAYSLGLISGFDGKFNPNDNITRQEMAKLLVSVYEIKNETKISDTGNVQYKDLQDISDWAAEFVRKAYNAKLMLGDDNNNFNPKSSATRAEAAAAVERFLNE
ncbi:MAG: S-layer homology domain-containing protein [Clostridia bacterium]|nr:S-layer homology domain-containing protein [Clostridia bacterium]